MGLVFLAPESHCSSSDLYNKTRCTNPFLFCICWDMLVNTCIQEISVENIFDHIFSFACYPKELYGVWKKWASKSSDSLHAHSSLANLWGSQSDYRESFILCSGMSISDVAFPSTNKFLTDTTFSCLENIFKIFSHDVMLAWAVSGLEDRYW